MRLVGILLLAGLAFAYEEFATTAQLMQGLVQPTQMAIAAATKETGPADDRAWREVQARGAMLQEAAQLLMVGSRAKDQDAWAKAAKVLGEVGGNVSKAAAEKNFEALKTAAGGLNGSCQGCHSVYRMRGGGKKGGDVKK